MKDSVFICATHKHFVVLYGSEKITNQCRVTFQLTDQNKCFNDVELFCTISCNIQRVKMRKLRKFITFFSKWSKFNTHLVNSSCFQYIFKLMPMNIFLIIWLNWHLNCLKFSKLKEYFPLTYILAKEIKAHFPTFVQQQFPTESSNN